MGFLSNNMPGKLEYSKYDILLFITVLCSTMMLVQFWIVDIFWILQVVVILASLLYSKTLRVTGDRRILALYIAWILSTTICLLSDIPLSYKKNSIIAIGYILPILFSTSIYSKCILDTNVVNVLRRVIVITCTLQLVWCLAQYFLYKEAGIDLNQVIFRDMLHMVAEPSQYKVGVYHPSGMCWHSAFIAPVAIFAFVLSDNYIIKCLAIAGAVLCKNSTALIGIGVCILLTALVFGVDFLRKREKVVDLRKLIAIIVAIILICGCTDFLPIMLKEIASVSERIFGLASDDSTFVHIRYFTIYPKVILDGGPVHFLFGYGTSNSGYPISKLTGQYAELKSWAVESDVMNLLYSNGILGFVAFYSLLLHTAIKGMAIDRRYGVLIGSLILAGITYNIQFNWVIFLELIMYYCVNNNINLMASE